MQLPQLSVMPRLEFLIFEILGPSFIYSLLLYNLTQMSLGQLNSAQLLFRWGARNKAQIPNRFDLNHFDTKHLIIIFKVLLSLSSGWLTY